MIIIMYFAGIFSLLLFSYGFVDPNFPLPLFIPYAKWIREITVPPTIIYLGLFFILFFCYIKILNKIKNNKLKNRSIWKIIYATSLILLFSYPAFSYDLFNYIATAKVTYHYRENPYLVMPIEIKDEPMLKFMHAANKTALYGPSWIILTSVPHFLSFNNLYVSIFTFKLFNLLFYLGLCLLIWLMSKKNTLSVALFALNPLVIVESLVSGHNDVVMMFFTLLAFFCLKKNKFIFSVLSILVAVLIKFAVIILLPIYLVIFFRQFTEKRINWKKIYQYSFVLMFFVFLLSPLREEMYAWYFIWPLSFYALFGQDLLLSSVLIALSLGLELRFSTFIYSRTWTGITPLLKKILTLTPASITLVFYFLQKKIFVKK